MALFRRRRRETNNDNNNGDHESSSEPKEKGSWKKPANTAFKQQRLKAWQPILTPKTVLPTLLIIGILFAPIGGLLVWGSSLVTELTFEYTNCEDLQPSSSLGNLSFQPMPNFNYRLRSRDAGLPVTPPQFAFVQDGAAPFASQGQCVVRFDVPADLDASVLMYYKLTNFFQNHRRYVKSLDTDQLRGKAVSVDDLNNSDCKPVATSGGQPIWPCGLIANSLFNDTISNLTSSGSGYNFTEQGIAWPGEAKKYAPPGYPDVTQIVPPPNWIARFPQGYNSSNVPDLRADERFQNWMRTAGLPTFAKLYGRNDVDTLKAGTYDVTIQLNYPVKPYKGTKSLVISTVSWIGGKNPFLGWAYVASSGVFVLLAIAGTVRHVVRPRRLGDMSLLSWNQ